MVIPLVPNSSASEWVGHAIFKIFPVRLSPAKQKKFSGNEIATIPFNIT